MALSINDVIALANAGFSKTDIAAFMNLGTDQNAPPATPPAPSPAPVPASAVSDYAAQVAALMAKIDALSVPNAGTVGNPPTVTSVDDIIRAAIFPKPAEGAPANQ